MFMNLKSGITLSDLHCFLSHSGAVVRLLNSTNTYGEGDFVNVCAELVTSGGGLMRPLLLTTVLLSGTAMSKY